MASKFLNRISPRAIVLSLLGFATALKVLWAMNSIGTCDVMLFIVFSKAMQKQGMAALYRGSPYFNHTPLTGWLVHVFYMAAHQDPLHFAAILRLACILADLLLVLGLLHVRKLTGKPPWWAISLFAVSPVSIMVSGFHGNVDPIMVMFLFFAAVAVLKDRPVWCGVMYAVACNIKIVPILVAPVFIFYWFARGRRAAVSFMGPSGALMLAGAAWGLINCPAAFLRNVFGYGSYWGSWGVTYWLMQTNLNDFKLMDFEGLSGPQNHVIMALKVVMMTGLLALAWRRRKLAGLDFFTTLGAAFTWIFVCMPGAGAQYMVWYAPFLLLLSPGWWTALMTGSAIYMARFYSSTSQSPFPWVLALPKGPEAHYWAPWTNLVWGTFLVLLICRWRSWLLLEKRKKLVHQAVPQNLAEAA